jgi:hypothetical protein
MTSPMPIPQSPSGISQPSAPSAPMNPADVMGAQPSTASSDQQDQMRNFMQQVQTIDEQVGDIARQFPEFAPSARKIKDELKSGMLQVVGSSSRGTEAPSLPLAV